ncbi:MAG: hypothetical protein AB8B91_04685 [Rubripirellula sp.]
MNLPASYPQRRTQKKAGPSALVLVTIMVVALAVLAVAGVVAWYMISGTGVAANSSYTPAVADALTLEQLQELCDSDPNPKANWKVPENVDAAIIQLTARDRKDHHSLDLQQRVAAEFLYGSPVNPSKREDVSRSIASTFQIDFGSPQEKIVLLKAFRRWGTAEHLPQLFVELMGDYEKGLVKGRKSYGTDPVLEQLLRVAEEYPTVDIAPWLSGLLSTSVGNQAEDVLQKIGSAAAPFLITIHDSDDTEAVARTTRLFEEYGVDETQLRIEYYLSRAKDDSSWDRRSAYSKLAGIPFAETYQEQVVDFLVTFDTSDTFAVENWQEAVLVWGDKRCLAPVTAVLRNGHYWDSKSSLPFIKKFGDESSIDALVSLLLADHYMRDRAQIAEALITLCKSNPNVDLQTRVHEPVLRQVHDFYSRSADEIWRVLRATNFDSKLLIQQTLDDLASPDHTRERSAWETMARIDVDESMRDKVTREMSKLLASESHISDQKRNCFLRWTDPGQPLLLKWLQASYVSSDDFMEIMSVSVNATVTPELLIVVADALADRQKQRPMFEILIAKCDEPAPVAVGLLESTNPVVLQAACQILGAKGNETHVAALGELNRKAKKARVGAVVTASKEAAQKIRSRAP